MSTITTTSQPVTSSPLKRLISAHPLVAYFVIAFAGTWAFLLPFALSRGVNGLGLLPFTLPDIAFFIAFILAALAGPALASLTVTAITSGKAGVGLLLRRCVQWRVGIGWYLIAIFGFFLIYLVGYSVFLGVNLPLALLVKWTLIFTVFFPQAVFIILTGVVRGRTGLARICAAEVATTLRPHPGDHHPRYTAWPVAFARVFYACCLDRSASLTTRVSSSLAIAATFLYTWIFNHTKGSVLIATLTHGFGDATTYCACSPHPRASCRQWMGCSRLSTGTGNGVNVITIGVCALLLLVFTRGRLGYNPERNAQLIEVPQPEEAPLASV